ncbi:MAG: hypothetical protein U0U70_01805 [Chitinophagaceae bacterium]
MRTMLVTLAVLLTQLLFAQQPSSQVTNQTIIDLFKAGLGKEVLISKIKSSECSFDLSTDGLIALKKASIPDEVITAMFSKPGPQPEAQPRSLISTLAPGIYYFDSTTSSYVECDASVLTNQKAGGLGEALKRSITGLFNSKEKAVLSGSSANLQFKRTQPVFTFVFDTTISGFQNANTLWSDVKSPNEFFLVKLKVQKKSREITVGKENNVKVDIGVDNDDKVAFISRKLSKGVYEVQPQNSLKPGEYCFMFAASSMYQGSTHKVFDFGVSY